MRVPDNLDAYNAYEREQARAEACASKCAICGEPIWEDAAYDLSDFGFRTLVCENCAEDWMRDWLKGQRRAI